LNSVIGKGGGFDASWHNPDKKTCMANPWYVVFGRLSPTKHEMVPSEALMEASMI
jgi:hypothetical protein